MDARTSPMFDKIAIHDLKAKGFVGVYPHEQTNKQAVLMDVLLWADLKIAVQTDELKDTIDYEAVANALCDIVENGRFLLLETLGRKLVETCFTKDARIAAVELTIHKPEALKRARAVSVTIYRERQGW